jgi:hypothetical protein
MNFVKFCIISIVFFMIFCLASNVCANPFVVSDYQQYNEQSGVMGYKISFDNGATWEECGNQQNLDGQIRVAHDLEGTTTGEHNILVKAYNLWEETDSVPFDYERQSPQLPTNMRLEHQLTP